MSYHIKDNWRAIELQAVNMVIGLAIHADQRSDTRVRFPGMPYEKTVTTHGPGGTESGLTVTFAEGVTATLDWEWDLNPGSINVYPDDPPEEEMYPGIPLYPGEEGYAALVFTGQVRAVARVGGALVWAGDTHTFTYDGWGSPGAPQSGYGAYWGTEFAAGNVAFTSDINLRETLAQAVFEASMQLRADLTVDDVRLDLMETCPEGHAQAFSVTPTGGSAIDVALPTRVDIPNHKVTVAAVASQAVGCGEYCDAPGEGLAACGISRAYSRMNCEDYDLDLAYATANETLAVAGNVATWAPIGANGGGFTWATELSPYTDTYAGSVMQMDGTPAGDPLLRSSDVVPSVFADGAWTWTGVVPQEWHGSLSMHYEGIWTLTCGAIEVGDTYAASLGGAALMNHRPQFFMAGGVEVVDCETDLKDDNRQHWAPVKFAIDGAGSLAELHWRAGSVHTGTGITSPTLWSETGWGGSSCTPETTVDNELHISSVVGSAAKVYRDFTADAKRMCARFARFDWKASAVGTAPRLIIGFTRIGGGGELETSGKWWNLPAATSTGWQSVEIDLAHADGESDEYTDTQQSVAEEKPFDMAVHDYYTRHGWGVGRIPYVTMDNLADGVEYWFKGFQLAHRGQPRLYIVPHAPLWSETSRPLYPDSSGNGYTRPGLVLLDGIVISEIFGARVGVDHRNTAGDPVFPAVPWDDYDGAETTQATGGFVTFTPRPVTELCELLQYRHEASFLDHTWAQASPSGDLWATFRTHQFYVEALRGGHSFAYEKYVRAHLFGLALDTNKPANGCEVAVTAYNRSESVYADNIGAWLTYGVAEHTPNPTLTTDRDSWTALVYGREFYRVILDGTGQAAGDGLDFHVDRLTGVGMLAYVASDGGVYAQRTHDHGKSWQPPQRVAASGSRPCVMMDATERHLWGVAYNSGANVRLARSADAFETAEDVELMTGITHSRVRINELTGVMIVAGWRDSDDSIVASQSFDNGVTLSTPVVVAAVPEQAFGLAPAPTERGTWCITCRDAGGDVQTYWSTDNGLTWSLAA
jgi:hypothetical protein